MIFPESWESENAKWQPFQNYNGGNQSYILRNAFLLSGLYRNSDNDWFLKKGDEPDECLVPLLSRASAGNW